MVNAKFKKDDPEHNHEFESYFKIGVSDDYILLRDDFPMESISPGDFNPLIEIQICGDAATAPWPRQV